MKCVELSYKRLALNKLSFIPEFICNLNLYMGIDRNHSNNEFAMEFNSLHRYFVQRL